MKTMRYALAGLAASALAATALMGCGGADQENTDQIGSSQELLTAPDDQYVTTPVGKIHRTCIREVASGSTITSGDSCRYRAKFNANVTAPGTSPTINGWVEYSSLWAPNPPGWWGKSVSSWYVPANPSQNGALDYYFPGFQNNSDGTTLSIIQPVMQWGNNGWFGGNYWTIASWYVVGNSGYHSTPVTVSTGQLIDGTMTSSNCSASGQCTWTITTAVRNGSSTTYTVTPGKIYDWAAPAVLEAYNLTACQQYPNQRSVRIGTDLYLGNSTTRYTGVWSTTVAGGTPSCNYSVVNSPNPGASYLNAF